MDCQPRCLYARATPAPDGRVRLKFTAIRNGAPPPPLTASLAALAESAAVRDLAERSFGAEEVALRGLRVVARHRMGRALQFVRLRAAGYEGPREIEAILRSGVLRRSDGERRLGDGFELGDVVRVAGLVERSKGRLSVHARSVEVEESWASLFGPTALFRDDAAAGVPEGVAAGNLLAQCVSSHVTRLREYLSAAHSVETVAVVSPIAAPQCPRDERCLLLRAADPAALGRAVVVDPSVARFVQRW